MLIYYLKIYHHSRGEISMGQEDLFNLFSKKKRMFYDEIKLNMPCCDRSLRKNLRQACKFGFIHSYQPPKSKKKLYVFK